MAYVTNRGTRDKPRWYAKYRDADGRWKQRATGQTSKAAALTWAREVEGRVRRGLIGVPEPTPEERAGMTLTVAQLCARFVEGYSRPKIKSMAVYWRAVKPDLNQMILNFTGFPLARMVAMQVKRLDVERWRDALAAAGYSPGSVNRGMGRLSRIYSWAIAQGILQVNPCAGVEVLCDTPAEDHYSLDEVHRLLSLPELPAMVWCALFTGMRRGELLGLTWPAVRLDGDLPRIEVRRSYRGTPKNNKPRVIPIHPDLLPVLRSWRERCPATPEGLVFPVAIKACNGRVRAWRIGTGHDLGELPELLQAAGCHMPKERSARPGRSPRERVWHTLRHTFASLFMEASGNGHALSLILGHAVRGGGMATMTAGYTHASLAYLARELSKLNLLPPARAGVVSLDEARRQRASS